MVPVIPKCITQLRLVQL
uniref:Uncharacterized protein n=1 Tax=Arundo donax TaxID=35708 RepID=A0A0A9BW17_ARUDO